MRQRRPELVRVWRDLLDAWKRSGQTVNAFCRDRKLMAWRHNRTGHLFGAAERWDC